MTGHFCPVDGCTKSRHEWEEDEKPFDDAHAVQMHVIASKDDAHVEAADEQVWDDLDDEDVDDQDDEETSEVASDSSQNESEVEEDGMVSHQEYKQQHGETVEEDDEDDEDGDDQADEGSSSSSESWLPDVDMNGTTIMLLGMALVAAFVFWQIYRSSSGSSSDDVAEDMPDADEGDEDDSGPVDRSEVTMVE